MGIAVFLIQTKKMDLSAVMMIALTAAAVFAILDLYAPAVGSAARTGAGFGIGYTMTGAPGVTLPGVPI